jgi:hypothetical protein
MPREGRGPGGPKGDDFRGNGPRGGRDIYAERRPVLRGGPVIDVGGYYGDPYYYENPYYGDGLVVQSRCTIV